MKDLRLKKIKVSDARKVLRTIVLQRGMKKEDAEIFIEEYIEGEMQGKISHGLGAFSKSISKIKTGKKETVIKKTHSCIYVDAKLQFGSVIGRRYTKQAIFMAKNEGIAAVFIKNMYTWLRPETLARYAAENGYIALVVNDGGKPAVSHVDGAEPLIGTNPIGIGIPAAKNHLVFDMASSLKAGGTFRMAKKYGYNLPAKTFKDKMGEFTQDLNKVFSVEPFGEHKGFAIALFIEMITRYLTGMGEVKEDIRKMPPVPTPRAGMIYLMNPQFFVGLRPFKKSVSKLSNRIKKSKRKKGVTEIFIPGEQSSQKRMRAIKNGTLDVNEQVWDDLQNLIVKK